MDHSILPDLHRLVERVSAHARPTAEMLQADSPVLSGESLATDTDFYIVGLIRRKNVTSAW